MSFWEDASPIVKGAVVVVAVLVLYVGLAYPMGWLPFSPTCSYVDEAGEEHPGCMPGDQCADGECLPNARGLRRP